MYNDCSKCTGTGEAICLTCHKKEIAEQKDENTATFEALRDEVAELEAEVAHQKRMVEVLAIECATFDKFSGDFKLWTASEWREYAEEQAKEVDGDLRFWPPTDDMKSTCYTTPVSKYWQPTRYNQNPQRPQGFLQV